MAGRKKMLELINRSLLKSEFLYEVAWVYVACYSQIASEDSVFGVPRTIYRLRSVKLGKPSGFG